MMNEFNAKNLPRKENSTIDYSQKVLEVKNLKKYFYLGSGPNKIVNPAVDNISFDVYKGEVFGLVGESGCGKTTTGRTIIKLYEPTDGTVTLNGSTIASGHLSYVEEIKRVKKEVNEKILSLDKNKSKIVHLRKEAENKIKILEEQINKLKLSYHQELKAANAPIEEYKATLYNLKNQFQLDCTNIKYMASLKKSQIKERLNNRQEIEYQNQLKIARKTFENKLSGLKDSAALRKEVIEERIDALKKEYEEQLKELKKTYEPLIEAEKVNILSKDEIKEQIKAVDEETKKQLAERKVQYQNDRSKVSKPNTEQVKAEKSKIKSSYNQKFKELKAEIQKIKTETKDAIAKVPKSEKFGVVEKEKVQQIKQEAKEKIAELKEKIRETKAINKSKETLKISQNMQMIFQDPISSLNPRMTIKEIISEGLKIQGGYDSYTIDQMVSEALEVVGLSPDYATRYPHEFSGGQRQRIGIARALIMNPDFIIADEPISALDVSIRAQIINLLTDLKDKFGLTILFIAHDLSVVRFFCDRIAVMYKGKIVEMAPSEKLFNNPQHPYTISLLSAIPQPDPDYEKGRKRIHYNPSMHDYTVDKPKMREIAEGHFVYANEKEFAIMKENYGKKSLDDLLPNQPTA